ncbi:tellurite resistance TerB family protein [Leucothrix arctica]|uniref:DUF533 domain-containing protein n=1 Tax=Leucothrix arctica TaxID=1481894 RepID=A0A317CQG9_9GAMM|nr:tellurite resistance TerB family protein [Leucothrix arctica]PWQ98542.1 DUF533 domain-containing protein [Leucothrix arctica]
MDAKSLLEGLLKTGREMAAKGQAVVEEKLDIQEPGEKRDATISGLKTGAMAAGIMALLLGTKTGRNVTGSALKLGSLAAVGGIAWQAYNNWSTNNENAAKNGEPVAIDNLPEAAANERSMLLLKAMIAAAKADGQVDAQEMADIQKQVSELGLTGDIAGFIQSEIASPSSLEALAAQCDTAEVAAEVYLISSVMINKTNEMESAYLDALAAALELPDSLLVELEKAKADASA